MHSLSKSLVLLTLAIGPSALAANFQMLKAGEWNVETLESSLGPATSAIKTKPFCIEDKDSKKDWESVMKDELKKTELDCKLDKLKEEATLISYHVDCTATEAAKGKSGAMPVGSKVDGTMTVTRESDTAYVLDQNTKATGLKVPAVDLSKVPEAQRKMLEGVMGMSGGNINFKMKQRYSFAKATCSKNEHTPAPAAK